MRCLFLDDSNGVSNGKVSFRKVKIMLKYVQLCITDREKERICVKLDARMCKKKKSQNHLDFDAELSRTTNNSLDLIIRKNIVFFKYDCLMVMLRNVFVR